VPIASPQPLSTNFPNGKFAERGKIDLLRRCKHPPISIFRFQIGAFNFGGMKEKPNWSVLIEAYNTSGLTQREFCLQKKIDLEQFKWRLRLSRREANVGGDFLQMSVAASVQSPPVVELHFPSGLFLRFSGEVGPAYLRELITGLRS
jgi:hypothetical protein